MSGAGATPPDPAPPRAQDLPQAWARPHCRVIADNDFAGDPDDLVQLAHHLLSPSVDLRAIISSHLRPGDPWHPGPGSAAAGVARVHRLLEVMGVPAPGPVLAGAEEALPDRRTPRPSAAAEAIVAEAMREDATGPLYVACGGGLTDLASAWLLEPRISQRLTAVWIGGPEYPGTPAPPGAGDPEYNLAIDITAAQVVFEDSDLPLWQVPRDAYRRCTVSAAELRLRVAGAGALGAHLYDELAGVARLVAGRLGATPETYVVGDSPLVLLTALQTLFEPDAASSDHVVVPAPGFDDAGRLLPRPQGRAIRVCTRPDVRLMLEDLYAKLALHAAG